MKILIIDNGAMLKDNNSYYTFAIAGSFLNELRDYGHRLSYCQFAKESTNTANFFDLQKAGIVCFPLKQYGSKIVRYLLAYIKLLFIIPKHDFVYLYYPNRFRTALLICRLFRVKYGIYVRGMVGVDSKQSIRFYNHAKVVLTVSDYFTNMINGKIHREVAHTIRPMIPNTIADINRNRNYELKTKYNILYLGRIEKDKGLAELVDAVNILKNNGTNLFQLDIVGDGTFYSELKKKITDNKLEQYINLNGGIYDEEGKKACYEQADIYVLPTYHEGFPRTLYESMIFGAPILTTFVGGIPSVMIDGVNCKKIEPKSADSIAKGIIFALSNYSQMKEFAKNSFDTVEKILQRKTHSELLNENI